LFALLIQCGNQVDNHHSSGDARKARSKFQTQFEHREKNIVTSEDRQCLKVVTQKSDFSFPVTFFPNRSPKTGQLVKCCVAIDHRSICTRIVEVIVNILSSTTYILFDECYDRSVFTETPARNPKPQRERSNRTGPTIADTGAEQVSNVSRGK
jgi:hypothetical protein